MKKLILLITIALNLGIIEISAQKIGGGEIYYNQFAQYKYEVTAIVYRKCNGSSLNQLFTYVLSDSFKTQMNMKRISISRINDTCGNPCNILNGSGNDGYEKHVYIDTVDFTKSPYDKYVKAGNCTVRFAIHHVLRDITFTTISNGKFYLEAKVNLCKNLVSNNSPRFTIEPKFMACCNQQLVYNPGLADTADFDSLVISMEAPLTDVNTPVSYLSNFNKFYPMTPYCPPNPGVVNCRALPAAKPPRGFTFDGEKGDVILTPTKCDEVAAIRFLIKEFRKDSNNNFILIGEVSREMQVRVNQCNDNWNTSISAPSIYSVCEGNTLCLTGNTIDDPFIPKQTVPDTTSVYWDNAIPTASFRLLDSSAREKSYQFCWNTNSGPKNGLYHFTVAAYDKKCNIALVSKGMIVTKKPKANYTKLLRIDNCNTLKYDIQAKDSNYQSLYSANVLIAPFDNINKPVFYSTKFSDSFKAFNTGWYIVKTTVNNQYNCSIYEFDTLYLTASGLMIANNHIQILCAGDTLLLKPLNDTLDQYQFNWYDDAKGKNVIDTNKTYEVVVKEMRRTVKLLVKLDNGCNLFDTVSIFRKGGFSFDPEKHDKIVCAGMDTLRITKLIGSSPFKILWESNGDTFSTGTSCHLDVKNDQQIKVTVTDYSNCSASDTIQLTVAKLPAIGMKDTITCLNSYINIPAQLNPSVSGLTYQWTLDNTVSNSTKNAFDLQVRQKHQLKLKITDSNQCFNEKTIQIDAWALPRFIILTDTIYNKAHFIHLSTDKAFNGYNWFNGVQTRDNDFWAYALGAPGKYSIWCEVTDSNGCKSKQQLSIETNGKTGLATVKNEAITFYPNPVNGTLTLKTSELVQLEIHDLQGKVLVSVQLDKGENTIDLSDLAVGIYTLKANGLAYKLAVMR